MFRVGCPHGDVNRIGSMMSKVLSLLPIRAIAAAGQAVAATTTRAATTSAGCGGLDQTQMPAWLTALLAAGLCMLLVWIARRIVHSGPLALRRTPGRSNSLTGLHVLVPLLLMVCASTATADLLERFRPAGLSEHEIGIVAPMVGQVVWLAAGLVAAIAAFRFGLRRGLGLSTRHWLYDTLRAATAYLAVLPVCTALLEVSKWLLPKSLVAEHILLTAIQELTWGWKTAGAVSAIVLAPLAEEIFFRGLVQSMLRRHLASRWASILITSLLFALMHYKSPQTVAALFVLGVVLGYNYERTGRLYPVILIHAAFNAVAILATLTST